MSGDEFDEVSSLWLEASSLFLSYMLPVEYIYGDWYWWLGTNEANKNAKCYMLSQGENCVQSGSRIEGFCIPQLYLSQKEGTLATANLFASVKWEPDRDGMIVKRHCFETDHDKSTHPMFVAEHLRDDPRYTKLRLTDIFKREFTRYTGSEFMNHAYLFPEARHPFLTSRDMKGWSYESHGPVRKLESTGITGYEEDQAYVFTYPDAWPEPAMEWLTREKSERPHGWPSPDLIQDIFESGCHIAPVGRGKRMREPLSTLEYACNPSNQGPVSSGKLDMDETEWRISFSVAENKLAVSLPPVQRHVMVLLKMLKKLYFQELISTYHLKQLLFWECERKPLSFWREENLVRCLLHMLDRLIECLKVGHLPHYIIRDSNLLQDVDASVLNKTSEVVTEVRRNLLQRTVSMLRRLQSLTYLTNIYFQGVSFDELVGRLANRNHCDAENRNLKLETCRTFAKRCTEVISGINRDLQKSSESEQLLLVTLNAYISLLARILCRQYALARLDVPIDEFLAAETGYLPQGDQIAVLCLEYYQQATKGIDSASLVPECKAMIEVHELRKKAACGVINEIQASGGVLGVLGLIQESDLQSVKTKLAEELQGKIDTVTYEGLEEKVMEELNAILQRKLAQSPDQNEN